MEFHVFAPSANAFHATGFSQWLMTDFPERQIHSAKNWRARFLPCRNFSVGQKPEHSKTRRLKSALMFFRHQLRTKVRSMVCFCCVTKLQFETHSMELVAVSITDYGVKSVA
jgi:hypothetical protein